VFGRIVTASLNVANDATNVSRVFPYDQSSPIESTVLVMNAGVLCVGLPASECQRLDLPLMVPTTENEESMYTAFTVTVDLREGITTGISASDRCQTIRALGSASTTAAQLRKPGHIFPLIAREHGVLRRPGHTEAAVDLARLAGMPYHAAVPSAG
jgi:3,4-dihydroxy-2-butanone 4-phosphate synthase